MKSWQQRERIVQTAARIMAEEGVKDYFSAKQKAADRLGVFPQQPQSAAQRGDRGGPGGLPAIVSRRYAALAVAPHARNRV
jgi:hypothetical protein